MWGTSSPGFRLRRPLLTVVCLFLLVDLVLLAVFFFSGKPRPLTVAFLDVGQGDAVFIEAPNGNQLLYDAGPPSGAVLRELARMMPFWDRSIDVLILSHPDLDHIGGAVDILRRYKVEVTLVSGAEGASSAFTAVEAAFGEHQVDRLLARKGETIVLGDGVFVDILYPGDVPLPEETNDASVSVRVRYGETAFILSGDLSRWGEYRILDDTPERITAQVLKLGHHGSKTSSSERWISEIAPQVVVISAGRDNKYGHPHQEVLDLLDRLSVPSVRTDQEGTIVFESDGVLVNQKE